MISDHTAPFQKDNGVTWKMPLNSGIRSLAVMAQVWSANSQFCDQDAAECSYCSFVLIIILIWFTV
eukprot:c18554_g2_i1 orf=170-367(+)